MRPILPFYWVIVEFKHVNILIKSKLMIDTLQAIEQLGRGKSLHINLEE